MAAQDAALGESPPSRAPPQGLPRPLQTIPNGVRNEIIAATGEFVGTFMFLFMGFVAAQVALDTSSGSIGPKPTSPAPAVGTMLYIAFAFGISLLVNAWVFFRVSGGMFNPAVCPSCPVSLQSHHPDNLSHSGHLGPRTQRVGDAAESCNFHRGPAGCRYLCCCRGRRSYSRATSHCDYAWR